MTTLKTAVKNLSLSGKIHLLGGLVAAISVFLPWYKEFDSLAGGYGFLGITGPTYLFGLLTLSSAVIAVGLVLLKISGRPLPKLPMNFGSFQVLCASVIVGMVILASSVLFHSSFGVNITDKQAGIGLFLSLCGGITMLIFSFLSRKNSVVMSYEEVGEIDFMEREKAESLNREATVAEALRAYEEMHKN